MDSPEVSPEITAAQAICAQHVPCLKALHAWRDDYGPGLELVTRHYRIFTTCLDVALLRRLPQFLESAHTAYNELLIEPIDPQAQSTVYLFADRPQWELFTRCFAGDQAAVLCKIRQGAYCHKGACVAYDIGLDRTLAALAHEGWHQFMTRHFAYRLPSWLDEGLAMMFESFTWTEQGCRFQRARNVYRLDGLRYQFSQGQLMSLESLLGSSPGEMMAQDNSSSVIGFYSQSYALVRFLCEGQQGRYAARFKQIMHDAVVARWPLDPESLEVAADRNQPRTLAWNRQVGRHLFRFYIDQDFQKVEAQYLAFCQKIIKRTGQSF